MATMKKFKLSFSEDYNDYHETPTNTELRRFGEILGLERKFHTIEVKKGDIKAASEYCAKAIVRIIAQHGSQLRKLIFFRVSLNNRNEFVKLMASAPMLETLDFWLLDFLQPIEEDVEPACNEPVLMKYLKKVRIHSSDAILFKLFAAPHVEEFEISTESTIQFQNVFDFIQPKMKLKSLEIDQKTFPFFFQFLPSLPAMKLQRFRMLWMFRQDEDPLLNRNFCKFLRSHANTLEHLELEFHSREVFETIFTKLDRLKILEFVRIDRLPIDEAFYEQIRPRWNLKRIYSRRHKFPNKIAAQGILGNCPNLESLEVPYDQIVCSMLPFLALNNPKLKTLSMETIRSKIKVKARVKFNFLTRLDLQTVVNFTFIASFIKINPTIDTLVVEVVGKKSSLKGLTQLMNLPNLKNLQIQGNLKTLKKVYAAIKNECRYLKTLVLVESQGLAWSWDFSEDGEESSQKELLCDHFE